MTDPTHELAEALAHPEFTKLTRNVDKMIYILRTAHDQKQKDFEIVLKVRGANRTYFSKSRSEIEKSGTDTAPRNIDGTPYWVLTKSSTVLKRTMLTEALRKLRYSDAAVSAVASVLN